MSSTKDMSFEEFKLKYGKEYKDEKEERRRKYIFESNQEAMHTLQ